jgi:hypothetical protein
MPVSTFLRVAPRLPASTSILLRGNHGIGKSQLGRQLAKLIAQAENLDDYEVIDRRLSQVSEGDIIGLPSTDGEVTRFNPPDWYKRACLKPCFLFLDELNRATPEVMQAAFQIVLDRELNGWCLHPQTRVMSAINASAAYNVNEVDPALLDRFWVIDLLPDTKDWTTWGRQENSEKGFGYNCLPLVVDFIANEDKWLDPPKDAEPGKVHVSRRSWERLGDALFAAGISENANDDLFYPICLGYVGTEAAIKFVDYAKTVDNHFTGKDIVDRYDQVRHKVISKKKAELLNTAIEKASEYVQKLDRITESQGKNLTAFMNDLPGELRISLWTKMMASGVDKLDLAKSIHKYLAKDVLDVFGVPMGEAGIGVIPNIPGIFKPQPGKGAKK